MTPAERSDTVERLAALLPQVQTQRSPSSLIPTPSSISPPQSQSPPQPTATGNGDLTADYHSEERVKSLLPSPRSDLATTCRLAQNN